MALAALSPSSVLASPIQVNPQVKTDIQGSVPQVAQDAQKTEKTAQTDTVTISAQALRMADGRNAGAEKAKSKIEKEQATRLALEKSDTAKNDTQKNAEIAYAKVSVYR
jgi:hypothetical protein